MNFFVTHSDLNYLKYAERLFETLLLHSDIQILYYTVDFDYTPKFKNVITKRINSLDFLSTFCAELNNFEAIKAYNVFLKPYIVKKVINEFDSDDYNFCYLDADCLAINNCDKIFSKAKYITDYPLLNKACYDFVLINGRGNPFVNDICDLNLTLEAGLMKKLNFDLSSRKQYLQTGVFLFNKKCSSFMNGWATLCSNKEIINDWLNIAPFHEETIINCLLWQKADLLDLRQSLINLPYNTYDYDKSFNKIKEMITCLESPKDEDYFIQNFCRIPSKTNIENLFFYHGKISDIEYNYIKDLMNNNFLIKIHSQSLGDTLAATPTLRKLYNSYNKKLDVITHHPDLFKNNKYVNRVYSFSDNVSEKSYREIFNTFLGVGGEKNRLGVEKKHNTIDIRQFHAIDLGFMLNDKEMEYDYIPNEYQYINNLPEKYVCLHVANTWPSRTYSDNNWQTFINLLNDRNIPVVLIGKNSHESGFYNIDKPTKKLNFRLGLDLTNKLNISQCWHVINKSEYFVTMDSGLLHLAGTTNTNIIQLGSSINYKLRAPFRNGSQNYKYFYVGGSCDLFCASDIKYGVKEWKTIQGVPPLINCLENKNNFDCHPDPNLVNDKINSDFISNNRVQIDKNYIDLFNFNKNECIIHYRLLKNINFPLKIKILDAKNGFVIHAEVLDNIKPNINFWTSFIFAKNFICKDVIIIFELNDEIIYKKFFEIYDKINSNIFLDYNFNYDVDLFSYLEIFSKDLYKNYGIEVEPNDVVVDIGSNVGAFVKYANDKKAKVIYSCEPNPNCIEIIKKYYNKYNNVILNEYAISDKNGETFLQIDRNSITSAASKILESKANAVDHYKDAKILRVNTITFKEFIKINNINFIDFLKIDCEGGEVFVFNDDNKDFFRKNVRKIILEYHNEKKLEIIDFLNSINYQVFVPNLNNEIGMIYAKNKSL